MRLTVKRYSDNGESTLGLLFIDGKFECYTLEDEARTSKVWGETRIPDGIYKIGLRIEGGHHARYSSKYDFHEGMLHVLNVPGFEFILIHIGNKDDDTAGCLLVGNTPNNNKLSTGFVGDSATAYVTLYKKVINAIKQNEEVTIEYINIEC